jgi:2-polyprenyl-3-methyl-5-hydroxy-6-metoxy-1,4-benzoquinol methylase
MPSSTLGKRGSVSRAPSGVARPATKAPEIERVVDEVSALFPEDVRQRVLNRAYHKYLHVLGNVVPRLPVGARVLDVGAGPGAIAMMLARLGFEVQAVDTWAEFPDEGGNISGGRSQILSTMRKNGVEPVFCDIVAQELPFPEGTFDAVLFIDVIEHLHESPMRVMLKMRRVLKGGGLLAVQTPNLASLKNRLKFLAGRSPLGQFEEWFTDRSFQNVEGFYGHVREYTVGEMRAMLEMSGFEVERVSLTNRILRPTPVGRDATGLRYCREFKVNSRRQVALALYFLASAALPGTEYEALVLGRKPDAERRAP